MFASDTTAAFLGFVVLCFIIAATAMGLALGGVAIAANRKVQKRSRRGFILAFSPLLLSLPALGLAILVHKAPMRECRFWCPLRSLYRQRKVVRCK